MSKTVMAIDLRSFLIALSTFTAILIASVTVAQANAEQDNSPLGIPVTTQPEKSKNVAAAPSAFTSRQQDQGRAQPTLMQRWWGWLLENQRRINRIMANAVKRLKTDNPVAGALGLILLAFTYGVLHAAGPGHGKAVISAYVLANEETVRRGIALSFLSAFFQAISAILFVGALAILLNQTSLQMRATENMIETISWGLVAVVGFWLLWRQIKLLAAQRTASHNHRHHTHHITEHGTHNDHHHHEHGPDCGCGHNHMPSPASLQGEWSWKKALPIALSVGIRPCTGALLLLIFSLTQGMIWAGILGTFAMAIGTALTVSILASLAVGSRNWAATASGPSSAWANRIQLTAGFAGATLVLLMGVVFFAASLQGQGISPL